MMGRPVGEGRGVRGEQVGRGYTVLDEALLVRFRTVIVAVQ